MAFSSGRTKVGTGEKQRVHDFDEVWGRLVKPERRTRIRTEK